MLWRGFRCSRSGQTSGVGELLGAVHKLLSFDGQVVISCALTIYLMALFPVYTTVYLLFI